MLQIFHKITIPELVTMMKKENIFCIIDDFVEGALVDREDSLNPLANVLEDKIIVNVTNVLYFFNKIKWG